MKELASLRPLEVEDGISGSCVALRIEGDLQVTTL